MEVAAAFLSSSDEFEPTEYTLRFAGRDRETGHLAVDAIHQLDFASQAPGAGSGRSRQLLIDREAWTVVHVLGFQ